METDKVQRSQTTQTRYGAEAWGCPPNPPKPSGRSLPRSGVSTSLFRERNHEVAGASLLLKKCITFGIKTS